MNGETDDAERDFRTAILHSEKLLGHADLVELSPRARFGPDQPVRDPCLEDRLEDARKAADQAVLLLRPLADAAKPSELTPNDCWLLSMALTDRGPHALEAGRSAAAAEDLDFAEAIADRITEQDDEYNDVAVPGGLHLQPAGRIAGDRALWTRPGRSSTRSGAALVLEKRATVHKLIPHYREELAATLAARAAVRAKSGPSRLADAESDCHRAQVLLEKLSDEQNRKGARINPEYLSLLSRALGGVRAGSMRLEATRPRLGKASRRRPGS